MLRPLRAIASRQSGSVSLMSRARRVDSNHQEIIAALRQVGASVLDLHALPGALDLLVGHRGVLRIIEVKDGNKSASRRKLTPAELETIRLFEAVGCPVHVVSSVDEALRAIGVGV